ncbi:MAG: AAA family ATPase, partial [Chromatiales bacterium]|nr:AAA family ATPase [Chromatiales bacterium]
HVEAIDATAAGLDLLSELMTTIKVEDTTLRTQIVDAISEVYAGLNQCRARARNKQKNVGTEEAIADFSAQFKLFSQSIVNALGLSTTPDRCDEQLSRLLIQLEELESQFSEYDQFLTDIVEKREEIYESFEARKQQLLDERQRKAQSVTDAAERIITSVVKRSGRFSDMDELNTFFSSDGLVVKTRELVEQLRELEAAVQADDIDARLKAARADAQRALRDSADLFEDGGNVIKLGPRHRFSVNTQELDLTIIPRNGELNLHLSGTNYFEPVADEELLALREYWGLALESESPHTYRGEYLASLILREAESGSGDASVAVLAKEAVDQSALAARCREFAAPRYKDGYERGIHDHDAALILGAFVPILMEAGPLRYGPLSRGLAQVFWAEKVLSEGKGGIGRRQSEDWIQRGQSAAQLRTALSSDGASELLRAEIEAAISAFLTDNPICESKAVIRSASEYLVAELARDRLDFVSSKGARRLCEELQAMLDDVIWRNYSDSLRRLEGHTTQRWHLATTWFDALIENRELNEYQQYVPEAVALTVTGQALGRREIELDLDVTVSGLLGEHALISNGALTFSLDGFLDRMAHHRHVTIPNYNRCQQVRQGLLTSERQSLRLDEFKPKPLSSFVRNKLIDECYLPIIGDNLAKQMGTVGESKRTDLMGLLMMISPPGYGKTTLMEYVASRLGLIFMKINCPSLGHDVLSLDPSQAPNATARQELMKVNLAFEMGNNVMLYLDDIQHTHPEFLQKFISLCDGTRRIEGVWKGDTKTYDLRGRKFCVVMAGNPYTQSGEVFKIPDMLANRADIYNLGDVLGGMEAQFELSYIENSLTSNPVLAPLTNRDMKDVYKLVEMAQGGEVVTTDLLHQYSSAEANEIVNVLGKMFVLRDVVLRVNQQYIASAAQDDKYRIEPPFKLQGSYRNMNKLAEKVSSVMEPGEMQQLLGDHYVGEAQLLTTGAEANLLKLAELREVLDNEEATRWTEIKRNFVRNLSIGGDDTDVGAKLVAQLVDLVGAVNSLQEAASVTEDSSMASREPSTDVKLLYRGIAKVGKLIAENRSSVEVINQPVPGMDKVLSSLADTIEHSFMPLVRHMDKKLEIDIGVHNKLEELANDMRRLRTQLPDPSANQRR